MIRLLDAIADGTARLIAWTLPLMVLVTCAVVILRYLFDTGAIWMQESVMYLHATAFLLGIGWTLKEDGHVRVDVIQSRLSERARAWIDLGGTVLFLIPTALAILYYSWSQTLRSWNLLEGSPEVGGIPAVFLLKTLIPLAAFLLLLQGIAEAARRVARLRSDP